MSVMCGMADFVFWFFEDRAICNFVSPGVLCGMSCTCVVCRASGVVCCLLCVVWGVCCLLCVADCVLCVASCVLCVLCNTFRVM